MQLSLALSPAPTLALLYARLRSAFGSFREGPRLPPLDQLIQAMVGGGASDDIAWAAFRRLKAHYPGWEGLADATPAEVEAVITPVPQAPVRAALITEALDRLLSHRGALSLDFLAEPPPEEALAWMTRLPGVGERAAAATLNFSTLRRRVMVVEPHVCRVARRIGLAPRDATPQEIRLALTEAAPDWSGEDFYDFHWLLKRLGQTLCLDTRARCGACPAAGLCWARRQAGASGVRQGNVVHLGTPGA